MQLSVYVMQLILDEVKVFWVEKQNKTEQKSDAIKYILMGVGRMDCKVLHN